MSKYYRGKRSRNIYNPKDNKPFRLSRSKIDLFLNCPLCLYVDRRLGVGTPPGYPFAINAAIDTLLKQEFDIHRVNGTRHPLLKEYEVDAIPALKEELEEWRDNFKGVQFYHEPTNFIITGAIDDLWINKEGKYLVVDYKATSKNEEITELNKDWQKAYKRQMEIYQWLLRKNQLSVSDTGYFVYCNGRTDKKAFDARVEFDITLIPYEGNDDWIEDTLYEIKETLDNDSPPEANIDCDFCLYRKEVRKVLGE